MGTTSPAYSLRFVSEDSKSPVSDFFYYNPDFLFLLMVCLPSAFEYQVLPLLIEGQGGPFFCRVVNQLTVILLDLQAKTQTLMSSRFAKTDRFSLCLLAFGLFATSFGKRILLCSMTCPCFCLSKSAYCPATLSWGVTAACACKSKFKLFLSAFSLWFVKEIGRAHV